MIYPQAADALLARQLPGENHGGGSLRARESTCNEEVGGVEGMGEAWEAWGMRMCTCVWPEVRDSTRIPLELGPGLGAGGSCALGSLSELTGASTLMATNTAQLIDEKARSIIAHVCKSTCTGRCRGLSY